MKKLLAIALVFLAPQIIADAEEPKIIAENDCPSFKEPLRIRDIVKVTLLDSLMYRTAHGRHNPFSQREQFLIEVLLTPTKEITEAYTKPETNEICRRYTNGTEACYTEKELDALIVIIQEEAMKSITASCDQRKRLALNTQKITFLNEHDIVTTGFAIKSEQK